MDVVNLAENIAAGYSIRCNNINENVGELSTIAKISSVDEILI